MPRYSLRDITAVALARLVAFLTWLKRVVTVQPMSFRPVVFWFILMCVFAMPFRSPAPLIYRPGEGWTYEPVGSEGKWQRTRAKDQLDVAQEAYEKGDYGLALRAARRVVRVWPLSDYAPQSQYLVARCYEAKGREEKAFKEYQKLLEKHPKIANYQDILKRQTEIADQYLAGKRFKLLGYIPLFPSMEKTAEMYADIVKNGPYSEVAPAAQLKIGAARDKQKDYPLAAKAYELAADRYHDRPVVAAEALYRQGLAYSKQAKKAEYDQSVAGQAIATFTYFLALYPDDPRADEAEKIIADLKVEQARGNFLTAQYYEKTGRWMGALVYYNEVLLKDPDSRYAGVARERIEQIKKENERASTR